MLQDKFESLADHILDNHGLQLVKKAQIRTALNLDATNATFHLESLIAGNFAKAENRAKIDHAIDITEACNCMDSARPRWMEDFGPWVTFSAMFRNVTYKYEQANFYLKFMPTMIQELATAEPGNVEYSSKISTLAQVNKTLQYFLAQNR